MKHYSNQDLDEIWHKIQSGDFDGVKYGPMDVSSGDGIDIMSILNEDATERRVFQRKPEEEWQECPQSGQKSEFE
jgi:hypothetical protein